MKPKNKILAGWMAFLFVIIHLSFIFVYAAPKQFMLGPAKKFVAPYISPLFEQSWNMFAPCPIVDGSLKVKIYYENENTGWFKPVTRAAKWHGYLRVSHHAELVLLESNLIYWVNQDVKDFDLNYDEEIQSGLVESFCRSHSSVMIKRYVYGLALQRNGQEPRSAKVIALLNNVKTGESGKIEYPTFRW